MKLPEESPIPFEAWIELACLGPYLEERDDQRALYDYFDVTQSEFEAADRYWSATVVFSRKPEAQPRRDAYLQRSVAAVNEGADGAKARLEVLLASSGAKSSADPEPDEKPSEHDFVEEPAAPAVEQPTYLKERIAEPALREIAIAAIDPDVTLPPVPTKAPVMPFGRTPSADFLDALSTPGAGKPARSPDAEETVLASAPSGAEQTLPFRGGAASTLMLDGYAALVAELSLDANRSDVFRRFGLTDEQSLAALGRLWASRFQANPELKRRFDERLGHFKQVLTQTKGQV
ncbi:MAG: hypothetical protein HOW73_12515 [Polyangiaceae bacterium]|nr:hypothetical protein [Polyangiaceae bacterium]